MSTLGVRGKETSYTIAKEVNSMSKLTPDDNKRAGRANLVVLRDVLPVVDELHLEDVRDTQSHVRLSRAFVLLTK